MSGEPGTREVAHRLFAAEFEAAALSYSESDEERAPNYVVTPTGLRANRLFVVGVLTEVERVNDDVLRGRVADPTGAFVTYAGQYQPEALSYLDRTDPPAFVALTGKARTFEPDDGDRVFTSVRPEAINAVDADTRDRWVVSAAQATLDRLGYVADALEMDERGEDLKAALSAAGVPESLAAGIPRAIDFYDTTPAYLAEVRRMAIDALELTAGERDEVRPPESAPDEGGAADVGPLPTGVDREAAAAGVAERSGDAGAEPAKEVESDSTTAVESATTAEADAEAASESESTTETEPTTEPEPTTTETEPDTVGASPSDPTPDEDLDTSADAESADLEAGTGTTTGDLSSGSDAADVSDEAGAGDMGGDATTVTDVDGTDDLGGTDDLSGTDDLGDFDSGTDSEAGAESAAGGDAAAPDTDEMYELDEEERREVEEEFGTEFASGNEVDDPGEADIDVPDADATGAGEAGDEPAEVTPEPSTEEAEPTADAGSRAATASESEAETATEPETGSESESAAASAGESGGDAADAADTADTIDAADVDLESAAVDAMDDLDDGDGADRQAVVARLVDEYGADPGDVEDAIQSALMSGRCYEPGEDRLKAI